jgi:hypothetical protein
MYSSSGTQSTTIPSPLFQISLLPCIILERGDGFVVSVLVYVEMLHARLNNRLKALCNRYCVCETSIQYLLLISKNIDFDADACLQIQITPSCYKLTRLDTVHTHNLRCMFLCRFAKNFNTTKGYYYHHQNQTLRSPPKNNRKVQKIDKKKEPPDSPENC